MVAGRRAALEARRRASEMAAAVGSDVGPCLTFTEEACDHLALSEGEDTRHPSPISHPLPFTCPVGSMHYTCPTHHACSLPRLLNIDQQEHSIASLVS